MKKLLLLTFILLSTLSIYAQTGKIDIKGTVVDTSNSVLAFSSVLLLEPADSALVTYALADDKGEFIFKNVPKKPYLLKATFVGYIPYQVLIEPEGEKEFIAEEIALKPIMQELYEVVVKTARAPISIKGDTIEYDASKFKVPPGSSVEDLLRKLPGVEVLQDGTVQAQGEEVKRLTVDGKRFFGDDPKMATKNLGADAVKKVQIFNDKTEQSKLTGVDDGNREKAMNLELKEDAKRGGFGKVTAGVGTDERMKISGNYNKFDAKNQLSAIGFGNNLNQSGMSWDDYQDFSGSNSFRWNDNGDFGFGGGGGIRFITMGGSDDTESFAIPRGGRANEGFSNNASAGVNYNYSHKKTELTTSYFYDQSRVFLDAIQNRESFLSNNSSFINATESYQNNFGNNHRVSIRGSKEIDSLSTLTIVGNGRLSNRNNFLTSSQTFERSGEVSNQTDLENQTDRLSYAYAATGIYRYKFRKNKRKSFALSATYQLSNSDNEALQKSTNEFFQATNVTDAIRSINQINATDDRQGLFKTSALFVQPLGKKFYSESFYNLRVRNDEVDRGVLDVLDFGNERNNTLSSYYINTLTFNRVGTSIRYSHKGVNASIGMAGQQILLDGEVSNEKGGNSTNIDRDFRSIVPNATFSYRMKNNRFVYFDYVVNVQEPQIRALQPVIDNSNPLYIMQGNPDLLPETYHRLNGNFNQFNPVNFTNIYVGLTYSYNVNQIVYNQTIDPDLLITTTIPENVTGGSNLSSYFGFGFPIVKTKATLNLNGNVNFGNYISFINDVRNETNTDRYSFGTRLSITPLDWFTFYLRSGWSIGNTTYSINTNQNAQIRNSDYSGEMNIRMPKELFLSTTFNLNTFKNEQFGFDQTVPIWNASLYKQFGAKKRSEIRLSAYDLLKRNLGITQSASQNFVSTRQVQTLSRYFMLSYTYNMRGVDSKIKKRWF